MTDREQGCKDALNIVLDKFRDFAWKKDLVVRHVIIFG